MVKKDLLHGNNGNFIDWNYFCHVDYCSNFFNSYTAGLVGLIVFRDVGLVSGAIYKRASIIGWKVKFLL